MKSLSMIVLATALCFPAGAVAQQLPAGYWPESQSQVLLDKTLSVHLAPRVNPFQIGFPYVMRLLAAAPSSAGGAETKTA